MLLLQTKVQSNHTTVALTSKKENIELLCQKVYQDTRHHESPYILLFIHTDTWRIGVLKQVSKDRRRRRRLQLVIDSNS